MTAFEQEVAERLNAVPDDAMLTGAANAFMRVSTLPKYSYNFFWQGRPIIQYPQDIVAMQELIWSIKPDLIIETGIAHGGSLIFSASMLALLEYCDAVEQGSPLDPTRPERQVVGLDIDIRAHNRAAIEAHPMANRIQMIQGSSIDPAIVEQVHGLAAERQRVLVCLDSNHTHEHVLAELEAYAPLHPRQLLRRLRHHHRRPASGHVPRPPLGTGQHPQDRRAGIPQDSPGVRDRQAD